MRLAKGTEAKIKTTPAYYRGKANPNEVINEISYFQGKIALFRQELILGWIESIRS
jgi:hypothetical protein